MSSWFPHLTVEFLSPGIFDVVVVVDSKTRDTRVHFVKHVVIDPAQIGGRELIGAEYPCSGWPTDIANPDLPEFSLGSKTDQSGALIVGYDLERGRFQLFSPFDGWQPAQLVDPFLGTPAIEYKNFKVQQWNILGFFKMGKGSLIFPISAMSQVFAVDDPVWTKKIFSKKKLPYVGSWGCGFVSSQPVVFDAVRHGTDKLKIVALDVRGHLSNYMTTDKSGVEYSVENVTSEYEKVDWSGGSKQPFPWPLYDVSQASSALYGIPPLKAGFRTNAADSMIVIRCGTKLSYLSGLGVKPVVSGNIYSSAFTTQAQVRLQILASE